MTSPPLHLGFWSLDCISICTVLGLALDSKDIEKACRKFTLGQGRPSNSAYRFYLLHRECHKKGGAVPKYLMKVFNERFAGRIRTVRRMECTQEYEVAEQLAAYSNSPSAALLWALLTDPRPVFQQYGSFLVHRFSYQAFRNVSQEVALAREKDAFIKLKEQTIQKLERNLERAEKRRKELQIRLEQVEEKNLALKKEKNALTRQLFELEAQEKKSALLNKRVRALEHRLKQEQLSPPQSLSDKKIPSVPPESQICETCTARNDEGQACPLKALQVAVVGGLDRQEPRYRKIVEQLGGDFVFHNGDCHGGIHTLKNMVCRSDIVVFVTRINSHSALHVVKGLCKKTGKRFVAIRETGPQALADALKRVA